VFLNMPVMAQPEAYLGNVSDDHFDAEGRLREGPFKDVVTKLAHAFYGWIDMVQRSRAALAEDAAHAAKQHA
jgi:chromate reductase